MKILALGAFLAATLLSQEASAQAALGANYNESLTQIDERELAQVNADWVRGFLDMHQLGNRDPAQDANVRALLAAKQHGRSVILSFKWNYHDVDFPGPGSVAMDAELARLKRVLPVVLGKVDILVIGNEPFIESKAEQRGPRLNTFYETLADAVIRDWRAQGGPATHTRLFMGAFNRLDLPANQTPAVERMLHFIASRPALSGADLHLHLPSIEANQSMLGYALPKLRPNQQFVSTEFSLVQYWKQHLNDVVPAPFDQRYGFPKGTRVYQVIAAALTKPFPIEEWRNFLEAEPWYTSHRNYLVNVMALYRSTGRLAVATYGMRQTYAGNRPFTAETDPWVLNSVFANQTARPNPDGSARENVPWAEGFRAAVSAGRGAALSDLQ
jgi:hypothetical protein